MDQGTHDPEGIGQNTKCLPHYDAGRAVASCKLNEIFFEELGLRQLNYDLEAGSGTQGEQTARTIQRTEKAILKEKPATVKETNLGDSARTLAS